MQTRFIEKAPNSVLDFGIDWTLWFGENPDEDYIEISEWSADDEIQITRKQKTNTTTSCYVGGGVLGKTYQILNTITTIDGRIDSRYITVQISENSV